MAASVMEREEQLVAFRLASETYAVPITLVHEIIRQCDTTALPRTAGYMRGVINLRGKIVPVIDLRSRLGLPEAEETNTSRIVVVETEQGIVGMMVDAVSQVIKLAESAVEPPSDLVGGVDKDLVRGVGKRDEGLVILLDVPRIMRVEEQ